MKIVNGKVNGLIVMSPNHFSKATLTQEKIMVTVWWSAIDFIHYSFLETNKSITAEIYAINL